MSKKGTVVLGVTGSIAAHKAIDLASLLTREGCEVHAILTAHARRFVTALPFQTLTRQPVITDLFDEEESWRPTHIRLADEADLLIVAPATAHCLAKLALGLADDALSCVALALNERARLLIAPAMHGRMWEHPATQQHVATLEARGAIFAGPERGLLSCGYEGVGRLLSVEALAQQALKLLG